MRLVRVDERGGGGGVTTRNNKTNKTMLFDEGGTFVALTNNPDFGSNQKLKILCSGGI